MSRKPRTTPADFLSWPETPTVDPVPSANSSRSHQPSDGISKMLSGDQITEEEAKSFNKGKSCSGYKLKEITGSNIFAADGEDSASDSVTCDFYSNRRTSVRMVQQTTNGISQIPFSNDEDFSPKKPITHPDAEKQRELSGTTESEWDNKTKKQLSDAKSNELNGLGIFEPLSEVPHRSLAATLESKANRDLEEPAPRNMHTSVKVSNPAGGQSNFMLGEEPVVKTTKKIYYQKSAEMIGNDIFKGGVPPPLAEKAMSMAKLKEMSGSNIFADGKAAPRDSLGGVRQPPGGDSSISLI